MTTRRTTWTNSRCKPKFDIFNIGKFFSNIFVYLMTVVSAGPQNLFKQMSAEGAQASRLSVDSGPFVFHYIIEGGVCYLTLAERAYPKKLAYAYLEDLRSEFTRLYSDQIETAARPYAFIKFGTCLTT